MKGTIRSERFDDVYFSADDGLAEAQHVFLAGNGLPEAFAECDLFVVAETGFGTGLNFLALRDLFEAHRAAGQRLHFVSFERYPLSVQEMRAALMPWAEIFGAQIEEMLCVYPEAESCVGRVDLAVNDWLDLTLIFEDVNRGILDLDLCVDCWFLDGFTPAKNPDMWSAILFEHMARLTRDGGTFATFTAAGFVKRGLCSAGFMVSKRKGFGRKRDMLIGSIVK